MPPQSIYQTPARSAEQGQSSPRAYIRLSPSPFGNADPPQGSLVVPLGTGTSPGGTGFIPSAIYLPGAANRVPAFGVSLVVEPRQTASTPRRFFSTRPGLDC